MTTWGVLGIDMPDMNNVGKLAVKRRMCSGMGLSTPIWELTGQMFLCNMQDDEVLFVLGNKAFGTHIYCVVIAQGGIGLILKEQVRCLRARPASRGKT
jgi:hypothetical protein